MAKTKKTAKKSAKKATSARRKLKLKPVESDSAKVEPVDAGLKPSAISADGIPRFVFTTRELATIFGISHQAIVKWGLTPKFKSRHRAYYYDIREAAEKRFANLNRGSDSGSVSQERARLLGVQADLAQLRYEEESGRLVDAERVRQIWSSAVVRIKNRIAMIPKKYSREFPDAGFAMKLLNRVSADIMTEVREEALSVLDEEEEEAFTDEETDGGDG